MGRPPEPTERESGIIMRAHDAIQARYGRVNWGSRTETMATVWERALAEGVVTREAVELTKRDSGQFWNMRAGW